MYVLTLIWLDLVKKEKNIRNFLASHTSFWTRRAPNYLKMLRLESSGDFEHLTTLVCLDIMRNLDSHPQSAKSNHFRTMK